MAFDLENFAATSERVQWEDLDFDAFDAQPLDDPTLRDQCLDEVFNQLYPESTDAPIPDSGNPDPENPEAGSPDQAHRFQGLQ